MSLNRSEILQQHVLVPNDFLNCIVQLENNLVRKTCILLEGDLAAGKTTFVQKFCEFHQLPTATSPTFSLHHIYQNKKIEIHHFDLYRLATTDEIATSGLWDVLASSQGVVFIEWPSRISENDLPLDWTLLLIELTQISEQKRHLTLSRLFR